MAPTLTERRPPWVVFTRHDDPWLSAEADELHLHGGRVFHLNGRELLDPKALFSAFARELRFPSYFGHNWDALVDCLHDWHGHGRDTKDLAVLIDHADALHEAEFLGLLVSVLCQAAWNANLRLDADGEPDPYRRPFTLHFAFLLDDTTPAAFTEAVARGMDVKVTLDQERLTATLADEDWPLGSGCGPATPGGRGLRDTGPPGPHLRRRRPP